MRILVATNYVPPSEGGIQVVVGALAEQHRRAGHHVTLSAYALAPPEADPPYRIAAFEGINPLERWSVPVPLPRPFALWRSLRAELAEADAVHLHGLLYPNVVLTALMARRRGLTTVVTEHVGVVSLGNRLLDLLQGLALRTSLRLVRRGLRAVVVLNDRVGDELGPALGPVPLVRIDNGVDLGRFDVADAGTRQALRHRLGLECPTVLTVARNARKKRLDLVLATARRLPEVSFLVIGRDTHRLRDLPPNLTVLGPRHHDELADWYRAADALLLPSEGEGYPLVVQEAMACGLPVVVAHGTLPEGGPHHDVVATAAPDPSALAAAVRSTLAGAAALGGAPLRSFAMQHYDWSATATAYLALLRSPAPEPRIHR